MAFKETVYLVISRNRVAFDGIVPDVDFTQPFITEAEAQVIRNRRTAQMAEHLTSLGWDVSPPAPPIPSEGTHVQDS
jgi:hypothetical protein